MVLKRAALFFLTLASAILLLHSIVPHAHEHLRANSHSHHHTNGDVHHHSATEPVEDDHNQEGNLADVLSIISHSTEGITFINRHHLNNHTDSKQLLVSVFLDRGYFDLRDFILPPLSGHCPTEFLECTSFHPCTNALRGPPAIAV